MASSLVLLFIGLYILHHPLSICGSAQGFSTELIIHPDSSESPLYGATGAAVHRSAALDNYSRKGNSNNSRLLADPDINSIYLDGFGHDGKLVLKLVLGTPIQLVYVIVSTIGPFSWVMCHPCETCDKFTRVIFNPSDSTTYKTVPCESKSCESIRSVPCTDSHDNCTYEQPYIRGSNASGILSKETLHLRRGINDNVIVRNFLFGCTHQINGKIPKIKILHTGYMGLNNDNLSIINQLFYDNQIPNRFSYCIPMDNILSRIFFGNTPPTDRPITTARLFINKDSGLYYVQLMMITVRFPAFDDSSPLQIAVEQEKAPPQSRIDGNMIIDSTTLGTFIDDEEMKKLTMKILPFIRRTRVAVPKKVRRSIDLCFDWSNPDLMVLPEITFHLSDNGLISTIHAFIVVEEDVLCLFIASTKHSNGVQKLGNAVIRGNRLELDLGEKVVNIAQGDFGDCFD